MSTVGEWPVNRYLALMSIETPNSADIDTLALASRSGWPEDLRVLIARFPREQWQGHANLGEMARQPEARHFAEIGVTLPLLAGKAGNQDAQVLRPAAAAGEREGVDVG